MENEGITFLRGNGGRIKLSWPVLEKIKEYLQIGANRPEAGGILLGRYILMCEDVVADEASAPMKGDRRGRHFFHRDHKLHQLLINEAWVKSNGTCTYLGEWHSHPENDPNPSSIDWDNWKRKLKHDQFDGNRLFFVIVGLQKIRVWEGDRRNTSFRELMKTTKAS